MSETQPKKYQCHVCGRTFSRNCDLLLHSKSYTDAKPYQYNICDSVFPRKCDHLRHNKTQLACYYRMPTWCEQAYFSSNERNHTKAKPNEYHISVFMSQV